MTTPTQAQIGAAIAAVMKECGTEITVGEMRCALTAAAQVGEQFNYGNAHVDLIVKDAVGAAIADTIERCAQEGVEFLQGLAATWRKVHGKIKPTDAAACLEQAIEGFATTIRKLKDK